MQPFVVCTAVHTKNSAKGGNRMLIGKGFHSNQSLSECGVNIAMAFFNIRFSSSSKALRFCRSLICCAVMMVSSSILTSEKSFTHLERALEDTPYSAWIWE